MQSPQSDSGLKSAQASSHTINQLNEGILLSICIASYNHGHNIHPLIESLLSYKGDDLEVVVSDNCSTDTTRVVLKTIKDTRFKLIENSENRGPTANYMRSLAAGAGKYVMFMTDKDTLNVASLPLVLHALRTYSFAVGYFALDYAGQQPTIQFCTTLKDCFKNFAYLSKHPTGYIYNNALLKPLNIESKFSEISVVGFFPFEFLAAELCIHRNCALLAIDFCVTGKLVLGQQKEISMTYSEERQNLFFSPRARCKMFELYTAHLNQLKLNRGARLAILRNILQGAYIEATHNYIKIINNEAMRIHYGVSESTVANTKLPILKKNFNRWLLRSSAFKDKLEKIYAIKFLCANA